MKLKFAPFSSPWDVPLQDISLYTYIAFDFNQSQNFQFLAEKSIVRGLTDIEVTYGVLLYTPHWTLLNDFKVKNFSFWPKTLDYSQAL